MLYAEHNDVIMLHQVTKGEYPVISLQLLALRAVWRENN